MKILLSAITILVFGNLASAQYPGAFPSPIQPSDDMVDNILQSNWALTWFVKLWDQGGFDTPKPNTPFKWSDYLSSVPSLPAKVGDMCRFMDDKGSPSAGLVTVVGIVEDEFPCVTTMGMRLTVPVAKMGDLIRWESRWVEPTDVVGLLRPHKAKAHATTSPTDQARKVSI